MDQSTTICSPVPVSLYLSNLKSLDGIPYIWDGKDPHGLDCSGCVTFAYRQANGENIASTHNCAKLISECQKSNDPVVPGMLLFYGVSTLVPSHVMTAMVGPSGAMQAYGACGGNHYCVTPELANKIGAKVQFRPKPGYRFDLLGAYVWSRLDYSK